MAVIAAVGDQNLRNPSFQMDGSGSYHQNPDRSIVSYKWDWDASDGVDFDTPDATGPQPTNPGYTSTGVYTVTLQVCDDDPDQQECVTSTIQVNVIDTDIAPTAVALPASRRPAYTGKPGQLIQLDGSASFDVDDDEITLYSWDTDGNGTFGDAFGVSPSISFPGTHIGQVGLQVTANGKMSTNTAYVDIFVTPTDLTVTSLEVSDIVPGVSTDVTAVFASAATSTANFPTVQVRFYDGDPFGNGTQVGATFTVNLPIGGSATLNVNDLPINPVMQNLYVFVDANSQIPECDERNNVAYASVVNRPPVLDLEIPDQEIYLSNLVPSVVSLFDYFSDPDSPDNKLTYEVTGNTVPATIGVSTIDSADGELTLTPLIVVPGSSQVTVTVTDDKGETVSDTFLVSIVDDIPPVLEAKDVIVNAPAGQNAFPFFGNALAEDNIDGALPVSFNPPSGSPFPIGTHVVEASATDEAGNVGTITFHLYVLEIVPASSTPKSSVAAAMWTNDPAPGAGVVAGLPAGSTIRQVTRMYLNDSSDMALEASLLGTLTANNSAIFSVVGGNSSALAVKGIDGNLRFDYLSLSGDSRPVVRGDSSADFMVHCFDAAGVSTPTVMPKATTQAVYQQAQFDESDSPVMAGLFKNNVGGIASSTDTFVSTPALLIQEGDPVTAVPGATYGQIKGRVVAAADGTIAFAASMRGVSQSASDAIFVGPAEGPFKIVAREGDVAPGTGGAVFATFAAESIGSNGDVAFRGILRNGGDVSSANNDVICAVRGADVELIAREGDVAPCMPVPGTLFGSFREFYVGSDGSVSFLAFLSGPVASSNDGILWRSTPDGVLHIVAREGDDAHNTEAVFSQFLSYTASAGGRGACLARLVPGIGDCVTSNSTGLWVEDSGTPVIQLKLRQSDVLEINGSPLSVVGISLSSPTNGQWGSGGYGWILNDNDAIGAMLSLSGNTAGAVILDVSP